MDVTFGVIIEYNVLEILLFLLMNNLFNVPQN